MPITAIRISSTLYPTKWRQDYVARLTGQHARFRVNREFCAKGKRDGVYGCLVTDAGVYEARIANVKRWELFDGRKWVGIPDITELARRLTPSEIDLVIGQLEQVPILEWDSWCVYCGTEVEYFTADGWPLCAEHFTQVGQPDWEDAETIVLEDADGEVVEPW